MTEPKTTYTAEEASQIAGLTREIENLRMRTLAAMEISIIHLISSGYNEGLVNAMKWHMNNVELGIQNTYAKNPLPAKEPAVPEANAAEDVTDGSTN